MPPRSMFKQKQRPSGLEFATCADCNNSTSPADLVASAFARFDPNTPMVDWKVLEIDHWKTTLEKKAPGVMREMFRPEKNSEIYRPTKGGILQPLIKVEADGPILRGYLNIFCAKFGMALYREHAGEPLPLNGLVYSRWFLNSGLSQEAADKILKVLPLTGTLKQGKFHVANQFMYRFNCDEKSIVLALAKFHNGLYVLTLATSETGKFNLKKLGPTDSIFHPGELCLNMPPKGKAHWI